MSVAHFKDLLAHVGHDVVVVTYCRDPVENVAIECLTCNEVLVEFNRPKCDAVAIHYNEFGRPICPNCGCTDTLKGELDYYWRNVPLWLNPEEGSVEYREENGGWYSGCDLHTIYCQACDFKINQNETTVTHVPDKEKTS
jgi:hypothetical protein